MYKCEWLVCYLQVSPGRDQDRRPRQAGHVSAPQGLRRGARRARAGVISDNRM